MRQRYDTQRLIASTTLVPPHLSSRHLRIT